jgi:hypothetical protein
MNPRPDKHVLTFQGAHRAALCAAHAPGAESANAITVKRRGSLVPMLIVSPATTRDADMISRGEAAKQLRTFECGASAQ